MTPLSPEVFQSLLAIAWLDDELLPAEAEAVVLAAVDAGLSVREIERLREMSQKKVEFVDIDAEGLTREQRLYVYAVASFIARADDEVTHMEQAGLHAVATLLGVSGRG